MAENVPTLWGFAYIVGRMRRKQQKYAVRRTAAVLAEMRDLERRVDAAVKAVAAAEQGDLFRDTGGEG